MSETPICNLVIGSSGFVGKPFCNYLKSIGEDVISFDIQDHIDEDARFAKIPLENVDRVYFLAWEVGGAKYLYRTDVQQKQLDWNLQLLLNIMPQLHRVKTHFLFVSSQLAEETDTAYGVTKRLGEVWTNILNGVNVRLWNVYGGFEKPNERSHVVSDFVYQALTTGKIRMLTTGEEKRQFIHIEDACRGLHQALSTVSREIYDITSFEWIKVIDVAGTISQITGADVIPGKRKGRTPITPIKGKIPGWNATVPLRDGLSKMIELYKKTGFDDELNQVQR